MIAHWRRFAGESAWANVWLYGAFFGSLRGTFNRLLVTDRIWMKRFTGEGEAPDRLDAILFDDFAELSQARVVEDRRMSDWVAD